MTRTTNMDYSSANPNEVIHSGHFMVSEFDDFEAPDDDENNVVAVDEPQMATVESQSLQRESMDMSTIIRPICDTADVVDVGSTLIQRRNSIGVAVTAPQLSAGLGYDFMTAPKHTCDTYKFGQMKNSSKSEQIDQTLSKLFRCMTLAFRITQLVNSIGNGGHITLDGFLEVVMHGTVGGIDEANMKWR